MAATTKGACNHPHCYRNTGGALGNSCTNAHTTPAAKKRKTRRRFLWLRVKACHGQEVLSAWTISPGQQVAAGLRCMPRSEPTTQARPHSWPHSTLGCAEAYYRLSINSSAHLPLAAGKSWPRMFATRRMALVRDFRHTHR